MDHTDHVGLLRAGVDAPGGLWADIGSGDGAFTLALADLLGPGARIVSVDRDAGALRRQAGAMAARFHDVDLETRVADFTEPLDLPVLDGLVMANSLHYVPAKEPVVRALAAAVRPGGRFVLVEYDADRGNPWVPFPVSFTTWERLAETSGLADTKLLGRVPSRFLGAIYSAAKSRQGRRGATASRVMPMLSSGSEGCLPLE